MQLDMIRKQNIKNNNNVEDAQTFLYIAADAKNAKLFPNV